MPTAEPSVIAASLRECGLLQAGPASDSACSLVEPIPAHSVPTSELLRTYEMRLQGLNAERSPHAASLHASTSEFVQRLRSAPAELLLMLLPDASPFGFVVFTTRDFATVIGCLRVASKLKMTADAWRHLWGDDTTE